MELGRDETFTITLYFKPPHPLISYSSSQVSHLQDAWGICCGTGGSAGRRVYQGGYRRREINIYNVIINASYLSETFSRFFSRSRLCSFIPGYVYFALSQIRQVLILFKLLSYTPVKPSSHNPPSAKRTQA